MVIIIHIISALVGFLLGFYVLPTVVNKIYDFIKKLK